MSRGCIITLFAAAAMQLSCGADDKAPAKAGDVKAKVETKKEDAKSGGVKLDADLPAYKPVAGVSGTIRSVGSDTMNNLMTKWGEGFKKFYPSVTLRGGRQGNRHGDAGSGKWRGHVRADEPQSQGRRDHQVREEIRL